MSYCAPNIGAVDARGVAAHDEAQKIRLVNSDQTVQLVFIFVYI